jgi:Tfp pilus assembly protein PilF
MLKVAQYREFKVAPVKIDDAVALALAEKNNGNYVEATRICEQILEASPKTVTALVLLSIMNFDSGEKDKAFTQIDQVISLRPKSPGFRLNRSNMLLEVGRLKESYADLVEAYRQRDKLETTTQLSTLLLKCGRTATDEDDEVIANGCFHMATELLPQDFSIHLSKALCFQHFGHPDLARNTFASFVRRQPIQSDVRASESKGRALGIMVSSDEGDFTFIPGGYRAIAGHTEVRHLLLNSEWDSDLVFMTGYDDVAWAQTSSHRHALLFNAVADPDRFPLSLSRAGEFALLAKPATLNHPVAVKRTARERLPTILGTYSGCYVPNTVRRQILYGDIDTSATVLSSYGLQFPILIRPIGSHTGIGLVQVRDEKSWVEHVSRYVDHTIYLTQYVDFRSADGYYRKYRAYWVGDQVVRNHLFVHTDWNVHGDSRLSTMVNNAWATEEEIRFLAYRDALSFDGVVRQIAASIGLDYFGVDFTFLPDGRMMIFEANASMRSFYPEWAEQFPYLHAATMNLSKAFQLLLQRRIST